MKAKEKDQPAPHRKSKFKREEVSPGVWRYNDPDESSFVLACIALCGVDISEIDDFIDGFKHAITTDCHGQSAVGDPVVLSTEIIEALLERRQDAFDAFKAGNDALVEAWLDALSGWCHFVGFRAAAQPEIMMTTQYRKRQSEAREGKPATHEDRLTNSDRDDRIRRHHASLLKDGARDATRQTATEFGVSPSTVQRAVRKGKKGE